jgi:enoyl-CoA hydratase/carnithine racemase
MQRAIAAAQELARLSPSAFAQTKKQLRQEAAERVERSGSSTDQIVTDIWTGAIGDIRDYVSRTLKKA